MAFGRGGRGQSRSPSAQASFDVSVADIAASLAANDLRGLERKHAPYRHGPLARLVFHAAAQDPRCSPVGGLPAAVIVVLGFLISWLWQVAAVYLAAHYELGVNGTGAVVAVGVAVAILVVSLDWDIVHHRVRGETKFSMLAIRLVFVTVMALLVSEAVAGWIFDKDIKRQVQVTNDDRRRQYANLQAQDNPKLDRIDARLQPLTQAMIDAEAKVAAAEREMKRQEAGLIGADPGRGKLYDTARLERESAQQALQRAKERLTTEGGALKDQRQRVLDGWKAFKDASPIVDEKALGPGERERALWTYLLANPDALWLRRVPLALVMIVLDLFAVIVSWGIGNRVRQRHVAWAAELDRLRLRVQRIQRSLHEAGEEQVSLRLAEWGSRAETDPSAVPGGHPARDEASGPRDREGTASRREQGPQPRAASGTNRSRRSGQRPATGADGIPTIPDPASGRQADTLPVVAGEAPVGGSGAIDLREEGREQAPTWAGTGRSPNGTAVPPAWPEPVQRTALAADDEPAWARTSPDDTGDGRRAREGRGE